MNATLTLDKAGRVVIPKSIREKMHLREGSRLQLKLVGDRLELSHAPLEVHLERRGRRRVIVGWEGFDAAQAVSEAREEHLERLAGKCRVGSRIECRAARLPCCPARREASHPGC